jgi:hypothetical protein
LVTLLKKNKDNKKIADHQLVDILILIFQLANGYKTNLDSEWKKTLEEI